MSALSLPRRRAADRPTDRHAERTINDFQSETAEITGAPDPIQARLTVFLLAGMVVLAVSLASVVSLERIVMTPGKIIAKSPTILVQPLETSIIRSLEVREGQIVRQGQILATLDPTFSAADAARLEREAASLTAEVARLEAETAGRPFQPQDEEPYSVLQSAIWRARQAEHQSKVANFDQRLAMARAAITRAEEQVRHYRSRLTLSTEVEKMRHTLERNQTGSRLNSLLATDSRVEISRSLTDAETAIVTASHDRRALEADRDAFLQKWRSDIVQELVARRVELDRVREDLAKAHKRRDLVELRAVEDAVVLEVAPVSVGAVVPSAEKILTLVPLGSALEVEVDLDATDQGFVKVGDTVKVKFAAYPYTRHGAAMGVVRTISEDSFAQRDHGPASQRFYKARIELTEVALRGVPADFRLIPGMPLTADIVVGERTIISYLVERAVRNLSEGMREP